MAVLSRESGVSNQGVGRTRPPAEPRASFNPQPESQAFVASLNCQDSNFIMAPEPDPVAVLNGLIREHHANWLDQQVH